jgi:hypothetical protein
VKQGTEAAVVLVAVLVVLATVRVRVACAREDVPALALCRALGCRRDGLWADDTGLEEECHQLADCLLMQEAKECRNSVEPRTYFSNLTLFCFQRHRVDRRKDSRNGQELEKVELHVDLMRLLRILVGEEMSGSCWSSVLF